MSIEGIYRAFLSPSYNRWRKAVAENVAATKIQRSWRKSRAGLTIVTNFRLALGNLSHKEFLRIWSGVVKPLLAKGAKLEERSDAMKFAVDHLRLYREALQKPELTYPICTSVRKGAMPEYEMASIHEAKAPKLRRVGNFHFTREAREQIASMAKSPPQTKAELDALVKGLREQTELIAWEHIDGGCWLRGMLARELLELAGVPRDCLRYQYIVIPEEFRKEGAPKKWKYHVALTIKLPDGSSWIIDPALSSTQALPLQEWIGLQMRPLSTDENMERVDKGFLRADTCIGGFRHLPYDPKKCLLFTTSPFASVKNITSEKIIFGKMKLPCAMILDELAKRRRALEQSLLKA